MGFYCFFTFDPRRGQTSLNLWGISTYARKFSRKGLVLAPRIGYTLGMEGTERNGPSPLHGDTKMVKSQEVLAAEKRIEELQRQLAAAQTRAALASASTSPSMSKVLELSEQVQARITGRARYWSGNANQTFAGRMRSHRLWMDEIRSQEAFETAAQESDKALRDALKSLATKAAELVAAGDEAGADTLVRDTLAGLESERADLHTLELAFNLSREARKAYTEEKTAPTGRPRGRPRKVDQVEAEAD